MAFWKSFLFISVSGGGGGGTLPLKHTKNRNISLNCQQVNMHINNTHRWHNTCIYSERKPFLKKLVIAGEIAKKLYALIIIIKRVPDKPQPHPTQGPYSRTGDDIS